MHCTARTTGQDSKGALTKGLKNDKAVFPVNQKLMADLLALILINLRHLYPLRAL